MILLAFFISFAIGHLSLRSALSGQKTFAPLFNGTMSLAFGLGISSLLTFICYLLHGYFVRISIISAHGALLGLLLYLHRDYARGLLRSPWPNLTLNYQRIFMMLLAALAIAAAILMAKIHPHGEWDAWGMWNLKYKFLILSDNPFRDIFKGLSWHTHPDYPLMLPMINAWIYSLASNHMLKIPMATAIVLTLACGLLVYEGLKCFIPSKIAFAGGLLLLFQPYYLFMGTAQYADILIAFYLLINCVLLLLALQDNNPKLYFLSGIFLGLMSFAKNEGLVMSGFLLGIASVLIFTTMKPRSSALSLIYKLFLGFLIFAIPTMIFKIFLAPPNTDILPNLAMHHLSGASVAKLLLIIQLAAKEMFVEKWNGIWIFLILLSLLGIKGIFKKESAVITVFLLGYAGLLILIYLTNPETNLQWWIRYSAPRIYFYLLPTFLFYSFYLNRHRLS